MASESRCGASCGCPDTSLGTTTKCLTSTPQGRKVSFGSWFQRALSMAAGKLGMTPVNIAAIRRRQEYLPTQSLLSLFLPAGLWTSGTGCPASREGLPYLLSKSMLVYPLRHFSTQTDVRSALWVNFIGSTHVNELHRDHYKGGVFYHPLERKGWLLQLLSQLFPLPQHTVRHINKFVDTITELYKSTHARTPLAPDHHMSWHSANIV